MSKTKFLLLPLVFLFFLFNSCKKSVNNCFTFDSTAYYVNDTIYVDAACSENGDTYLWEPSEGLIMLGSGTSSTESFKIVAVTGALSRTISLTVSNSKSSRNRTESVVVL